MGVRGVSTGDGICSCCGEECDAFPTRDEIDAPYGSINGSVRGPIYWVSCCCKAEVKNLKVYEGIDSRW